MTIFRQRSKYYYLVFLWLSILSDYIISSSHPYYYVLQSRRPSYIISPRNIFQMTYIIHEIDYISFATIKSGSSLIWRSYTIMHDCKVRIGAVKLVRFDYSTNELSQTSSCIVIREKILAPKIIFLVFFGKDIGVNFIYSSRLKYKKTLIREV